MTLGIIVVGGITALVAVVVASRARRAYAVRFEPLPTGLRQKLAKQYPQYSSDQLDAILEGLRDWFRVAQLAQKRFVSMPSRAVDAAWHDFILFTQSYDTFCRKVLGRFLHHVPAEAMRSRKNAQLGMRRTWRLACAIEGIDPHRPSRLPRLFALDAALAFPLGFYYALDCASAGTNTAGYPYCASDMGCASGCGAGTDGSVESSASGDGSGDGGGGDGGGSSCGGGCGGGGGD